VQIFAKKLYDFCGRGTGEGAWKRMNLPAKADLQSVKKTEQAKEFSCSDDLFRWRNIAGEKSDDVLAYVRVVEEDVMPDGIVGHVVPGEAGGNGKADGVGAGAFAGRTGGIGPVPPLHARDVRIAIDIALIGSEVAVSVACPGLIDLGIADSREERLRDVVGLGIGVQEIEQRKVFASIVTELRDASRAADVVVSIDETGLKKVEVAAFLAGSDGEGVDDAAVDVGRAGNAGVPYELCPGIVAGR